MDHTTSCPECGHSILSHKNGQCLAVVFVLQVMPGERAKRHCGCTHIQPPNSEGIQIHLGMIDGEAQGFTKEQVQSVRKRRGIRG